MRGKRSKSLLTIAIIGIDGSGKSTVSEKIAMLLSHNARVVLISDSLVLYRNGKQHGIEGFFIEKVRHLIGRFAKKSRSLKIYKIPKLTELFLRDSMLKKAKQACNPDFIVLDGSPLLNLTAWSILYKEKSFCKTVCRKAMSILTGHDQNIIRKDPVYEKYPELAVIRTLGLNHLTIPDIVGFLDVSPVDAVSRIKKRGKRLQPHETKEKLRKLRAAYRIVCDVVKNDFGVPVCYMRGNKKIQFNVVKTVQFIKHSLKRRGYHYG